MRHLFVFLVSYEGDDDDEAEKRIIKEDDDSPIKEQPQNA